MDKLWTQINQAIHTRDTQGAARLIPKYLKAWNHSPEATYEASEFYRKLSNFREALRVLPKETTLSAREPMSEIDAKLQIQLARILNALGASEYALRSIAKLKATNQLKSTIEVVGIYISNYCYAEALALLAQFDEIPRSEPWHQDWLLHIYRADALSGLGRWEESLEIVDRIGRVSTSPLIQAIAKGARAEYLTKAGRPKAALPAFCEAESFFQSNDCSVDHGLLRKWLGVCYLKLGRLELAEAMLAKAFQILHRPGSKPESGWEALLWRDRLPSYNTPGAIFGPRLLALTGPEGRLIRKSGLLNSIELCEFISASQIEPKRKARHISRATDTSWIGSSPKLGLDSVDEMVASLICAGEYGLPQFRLYEILWPHEFFSFELHQKRLEQLVIRARARGFKISWKDTHLWINSKGLSTDGWPSKIIRGGSFLKENREFTRNDVERYFSISKSSALQLCHRWLEEDLVCPISKAKYGTKGSSESEPAR